MGYNETVSVPQLHTRRTTTKYSPVKHKSASTGAAWQQFKANDRSKDFTLDLFQIAAVSIG